MGQIRVDLTSGIGLRWSIYILALDVAHQTLLNGAEGLVIQGLKSEKVRSGTGLLD
jgi:hypothetical protein